MCSDDHAGSSWFCLKFPPPTRPCTTCDSMPVIILKGFNFETNINGSPHVPGGVRQGAQRASRVRGAA